MPELYIGCGLTGAPEQFLDQIDVLKNKLRKSYGVLDFIGLAGGTNEDVYRWDIEHCVADCDMFIAVCDHPSTGLGWELAEATRLNKPTIGTAHTDARVTRLVLGAAGVHAGFDFARYKNMVEDVPKLIKARVESLKTE